MPTPFQSILDRSARLLERNNPQSVTLGADAAPTPAIIGQFRRTRVMLESGWRHIVRGRVSIRRSALLPGRALPVAGSEVTVEGKTYRLEYDAPDTVNVTLDLINVE